MAQYLLRSFSTTNYQWVGIRLSVAENGKQRKLQFWVRHVCSERFALLLDNRTMY